MTMHANNPRLMDGQLASYLKRFASDKSDTEKMELSMAFYAGAMSLQRVEQHIAAAHTAGEPMKAQMIAMAITEEIADAASRLLKGTIVPGENVKPE